MSAASSKPSPSPSAAAAAPTSPSIPRNLLAAGGQNPSATPIQPTPAALAFLTIYNPSFGVNEQIVFYTSRKHHDTNERLRQIGLAQGIVEFARGFSKGRDLESVVTQKSSIVLKELEKGWWILASINLTVLPRPDNPLLPEYSSRDISPPSFLISQLVSAYEQYRLIYGTFSLGYKQGRNAFCKQLDRFFRNFAWRWDVLFTGDPASGGVRYSMDVEKVDIETLEALFEEQRSKGVEHILVLRFVEETRTTPAPASGGMTFGLWSKKPAAVSPALISFPTAASGVIHSTLAPIDDITKPLTTLVTELYRHPKSAYLICAGKRKRKAPTKSHHRSESLSRKPQALARIASQKSQRSMSVGPAMAREHSDVPSIVPGMNAGMFLSYLVPNVLNPWGGSASSAGTESEAPTPGRTSPTGEVEHAEHELEELKLEITAVVHPTEYNIRVWKHKPHPPDPTVGLRSTFYYVFLSFPNSTPSTSSPVSFLPPLLSTPLPNLTSSSTSSTNTTITTTTNSDPPSYHISLSSGILRSSIPPIGSPAWAIIPEGVFLWRQMYKLLESGGGKRKVVVGGVGWWVEWVRDSGSLDGGGKGRVWKEEGK